MVNEVSPIPIPAYFAGQSILITGGTGFMGKVLIEKILRCCPDVIKIYLLMRTKKGKSIAERCNEMTNLQLFNKLKETNPDALKKIQPISGEIMKDRLGLSDENEQILRDNVNIIFHMAAAINFTDQLVEPLICNTKATYLLLNFARTIKNFKVFVYTSTAYSNFNLDCHEAAEEILPAVQDWRVLLKLIDTEPMVLASLKEKLLCGHPNPYTFSKSIAEQVVDSFKQYFPVIVMRPAVVGPCLRAPLESWADALSGITAIILPLGLGMMRISFSEPECYQDYIPCDTAINATLVATAKRLKQADAGHTEVYTCGWSSNMPMPSWFLKEEGTKIATYELPSSKTIWKAHCIMTTNEYWYRFLFFILQVIPAVLVDWCLLLASKKPMLMNVTKKCSNLVRIFKKFSTQQISFPNSRFKELEKFIPDGEKNDFTIESGSFTTKDILRSSQISNLKYFLKESISEEALEKNRKKLFWLQILDRCVVYGFYSLCGWLLYRNFLSPGL